MPCAAGYPQKVCPFGWEGQVTREACGACRNFIPPAHILAHCMLWDRERALCMRPKSDCATCPEKMQRAPGRPRAEGVIDWQDPKSVAAYHRDYRKKNPPTKSRADYMRAWRKANPKSAKEIARRARAARKAKKNEPG